MKRKVKKFNEGGETKYNREDEGLLGGKVKYREDEEGRKYTAGRANPMDRNPQEQRYYSVDDIKGKLSGLFGGSSEDSKSFSKFKDLESVGGAGRRPRTIEEQIGPKAKPKADVEEPIRKITDYSTNKGSSAPSTGGTTYTNEEAINRVDAKPEAGSGSKPSSNKSSSSTSKSTPPGRSAREPANNTKSNDDRKSKTTPDRPSADSKSSGDNKPNRYPAILEDSKSDSKAADKPAKSSSGSYSDNRYKEYQANNAKYQKMLDSYKSDKKDKESKSEPTESGADKRKKLEAERKTQSKNFTEGKKGLSSDDRYKTYKDTNAKYQKMLDDYKSGKKDKEEEAEGKKRRNRALEATKKDNYAADITGSFHALKKGGSVKSASARADGIAIRGKTRA